MPSSVHSQFNEKENQIAEMKYKKGVELLKGQKPRDAIPYLSEAVQANPNLQDARFALQEAIDASKWNVSYFCKECGKLILPNAKYPMLNINGFCSRCGSWVNTQREIAFGAIEIITKVILFGIFPVLVFIFCGMPNYQFIPEKGTVESAWNDLPDGTFSAAAFTPLMLIILSIINDPWALTKLNFLLFAPLLGTPHYFLAGMLLLFLALYLYFFLLWTPFITIHRRAQWRSKQHQKILLLYTVIVFACVMVPRIVSGVFR